MVRNAIRIIALTIFKLNDEQANKLLLDLPFCSYFSNLACYYRDKILDLDQSYAGSAKSQKKESIENYVEELQDLMEFF